MLKPTTLGAYLAERRRESGLTLRQLGGALRLSPQYLSDVERDRRPLAPSLWDALVRACPACTLEGLAFAAVNTWPVKVDLRGAPFGRRCELAALLVQQRHTVEGGGR